MSDRGEKTCPLCAEEMDLTDQQLKPCKCGYEICIWCWHHIMGMAEKDETEGRCPACRTPYNKEKIVGMAANRGSHHDKLGRLVAEMNTEKKTKSQKAKSKTADGRKQLSSVRVIQRNLVYIVGLPLNLADEDLLQRRDYFSQYGKVQKVSISRTAAGTIQQFANNTCSVYITYSKEEEAIRCIQSVHGFVLDGRSLRACFGTTKYCHAWLRNLPCSNPDCLYLHEIGPQDDSFSKDEIVSAYTRSRVQQITGASNTMQWRSGNVLPPPADEYNICSSVSSGKPSSRNASNNPASTASGSPPNSSSGRSVALPAATFWGTRASNSQPPPSGSLACSDGPSNQKPETCNGSMAFSTAVAGTIRVPLLHVVDEKKHIPKEQGITILHKGKQEPLEPGREASGTDHCTAASEAPATPGLSSAASTMNGQLHSPASFKDKDRCISAAPNMTNPFDPSGRSSCLGADKYLNISANGDIQNKFSDMEAVHTDRRLGDEHAGDSNNSLSENTLWNSPQNQGLQQRYPEHFRVPSPSIALEKALTPAVGICVAREQSDLKSDSLTREQSDWRSDSQTQVGNSDSQVAFPEVEEDFRYLEYQRNKDPEVVSRSRYLPNLSHSFHLSVESRDSSQQNEHYGSTSFNRDTQIVDNKEDKCLLLHSSGVPKVHNGFPEDIISKYIRSDSTVGHSYWLPSEGGKNHVRLESKAANVDHNVATDFGESSIISNILSMDFDAWDESLTSPQNLVKLMGDTDRREGSLKPSSSWKVQNSSQSRFSFARQEESKIEVPDVEQSLSNVGQVLKHHPLSLEFPENRVFSIDKLGDSNGFSPSNIEEPDFFAGSNSYLSSNKLPVSRAQVSAPPGFTGPTRAPPPGFTSHERTEPTFDDMPWNNLVDASSSLRNPYQVPPTGNSGSAGDIEFMDPAILAVGKGSLPGGLNNAPSLDMRSNYPSQFSAFENEARLQMLMQRSVSPLQNQRFADLGDGFAPHSDAYRSPSRIMEQTLASNPSPLSRLTLQQSRSALMLNGQWDGWNEVQRGNDLGMAQLLRTERLGLNKLYTGYEDSKFRMPSSGNLYNRTYGM